MTDLPQIYAEITAKRPELEVDGLTYSDTAFYRLLHGIFTYAIGNDEAEALIGWHWVKMLPPSCSLRHILPDLWTCGNAVNEFNKYTGPTPLAALAAFWRQQ